MKTKIQLVVLFLLFVAVLSRGILMDREKKEESTINIKGIVSKEAKEEIKNMDTLLLKKIGENNKFIFSEDEKIKGIYSIVSDALKKSTNIKFKVINDDDINNPDLIFGPANAIDLEKYNITKPFFYQSYMIYTTQKTTNLNELASSRLLFYTVIDREDFKMPAYFNLGGVELCTDLDEAMNAVLNGEASLISDIEILELVTNKDVYEIISESIRSDYVIGYSKTIPAEVGKVIESFADKLMDNTIFGEKITEEIYSYHVDKFSSLLTDKEKEWIENNRSIKYTTMSENYAFMTAINEEAKGIDIDVVDRIEKLTGLDFEYQYCKELSEGELLVEQVLDETDIDMVTKITDINIEDNKELVYTSVMYDIDLFVMSDVERASYISDISQLQGKTCVQTKKSFLIDILSKTNLNINIIEVDTMEDIIEQLRKNKGYVSIIDSISVNYYAKDNNLYGVRAIGRINNAKSYVAIEKDLEEFASIWNKALRLIDVNKYTYSYALTSDEGKTQITWLIPIMIIILIILVLTLYLQTVLIKVSKLNRIKQNMQKVTSEYDHMLTQIITTFERASMLAQNEEKSFSRSHAKRLMLYCELLASEYGLDQEMRWEIAHYVPLHDIGNIGVDNDLFHKGLNITPEEYEKIKTHVIAGKRLIEKLKFDKIAVNIVEYHHERWDGMGYNMGLKGDAIPIEARIVHLADTYDILRMRRPYKAAMNHEDAMFAIIDERGKQFDPRLVDIFVKHNDLFRLFYDTSIEMENKLK